MFLSSPCGVLVQGISYFRNQDYGPAGEKFEKVLRDARCIGEGKLEARALGNLATVSSVAHGAKSSPSTAPRRPSLSCGRAIGSSLARPRFRTFRG